MGVLGIENIDFCTNILHLTLILSVILSLMLKKVYQ